MTLGRFWPLRLGLLLCVTLVLGCTEVPSPKKSATGPEPGAADNQSQVVAAKTAGTISSHSPIRVQFVDELIESAKVGGIAQADLFDFEPPIEGLAVWASTREIQFRPAKPLPQGQVYQGRVNLGHLTESNPEALGLKFQVMFQAFEIELDGLTAEKNGASAKQILRGTLRTADISSNRAVESILKSQHEKSTLSTTWNHVSEREHQFAVAGLVRQSADTKLTLTLNGESIGVGRTESIAITVPGLSHFSIIHVRPMTQGGRHVEIRFSDPVREKQNFQGLIRAGRKNLRYTATQNVIRVYSAQAWQARESIEISGNLLSATGLSLKSTSNHTVQFSQYKPAVQFVGGGVLLPSKTNFTLPIQARGLSAIHVEAMRIRDKQLPQFFQVNELWGRRQISRVGRTVWQDTVKLDARAPVNESGWSQYGLDMKPLVQEGFRGLYRLKLSFKSNHITYPCESSDNEDHSQTANITNTDQEEESSFWDSISDGQLQRHEYYENRHDPCHPGYYRDFHDHKIVQYRNILISDLGMLAKLAQDNTLTAAITDINTGTPRVGVQVVAMDYQQNIVGKATTNAAGMVQIKTTRRPFLLSAQTGDDKNYLRLGDGQSLSVSHFDTGGVKTQKGIKGFIYGERGVWRPGDNIHLTFVLFDSAQTLPKTHPVHFQLTNSRGQIVERHTLQESLGGLYTVAAKTERDAPTGHYTATFFVGAARFEKTLKIETVVPNRLKVALETKELVQWPKLELAASLASQWLHGAPANKLKVDVSAKLRATTTRFAHFDDYTFDDPTRRYSGKREEIYQGLLDAKGNLEFKTEMPVNGTPSGMLKASVVTRVYEPSGAFSQSAQTVSVSPYEHYVGLRVPKGDKARGMLMTDTNHAIQVVRVDSGGAPKGDGKVTMNLYKIGWRWWWQQGSESLADFVSSSEFSAIQQGTAQLAEGKATWNFKVDYPNWGRYLVTAVDQNGKHRSAKIVYIDWPGWAGKARKDNPGGASVLSLSADKNEYTVGEPITLTMPSSPGAKILVSIETGSRILRTEWIESSGERTRFTLPASENMAPTAYAHVTLIQGHANTLNDAPIRMYGIVPLKILNSATRLSPVLATPESYEPNSTGKLSVGEKSGKPMSYTVAIVDEGLLGLTNYKTPDPWKTFYRREALGVTTWDNFDQVVGAFGGKLSQLLSIGGSEDEEGQGERKRANRFVPMVRFLGPFTLAAGETKEHSFDIPQYVGAVRAMVVAADTKRGAFGQAHQEIPVRKPLMVLATLPRVLGPNEFVQLPVSVFAMTPEMKQVSVEVTTKGPLKLQGPHRRSLSFSGPGDSMVKFPLQVLSQTGIGIVEVTAQGHTETATQRFEIDIRHRNPPVNKLFTALIDPGNSWQKQLNLPGMAGTNTASLEVSHLPPLNLEERLDYLVRYPHGCVEQTTSSVFPQLFLSNLMELSPERQQKIQNNVTAGIKRLKSFQIAGGGFGYWPGQPANAWGTNYAGHFLLEAKALGYSIPAGVLEQWKNFQTNKAQAFANSQDSHQQLTQAYRLFGLALAKSPDLSAMNRLKESPNLQQAARWRLAATYHLTGKTSIAKNLLQEQSLRATPYRSHGPTYGSSLRDQALMLDTLSMLGEREKALKLAREISQTLSTKKWLSTQSTAFALLGMIRFVGQSDRSAPLEAAYGLGQNTKKRIQTSLPMATVSLAVGKQESPSLTVHNTGKNSLFVRVSTRGVPKPVKEEPAARGLALSLTYSRGGGQGLDISSLAQGEDFEAHVVVTNKTLSGTVKDIALSQVVPSGWEIHNERLLTSGPLSNQGYEYQDIRDDRVYTYFDLKQGESRHFSFKLNASYLGRFYMPQVSVEAMYDGDIYARDVGNWVEVVKAGPEG